jgi:MSHA pilin protein MshA
MKMLNNRQQGFTLIELIMVIVILGILAATALPKFVDLSSDARKSSLKGMGGAIQGAKSIIKAGYLIAPAATVTLDDGTTTVAVRTTAPKGIPTAVAAGIGNAVEISADFTPTYASGVATFTLQTNCYVTYTEASGAVVYTEKGC